jgi:hypothetical protein
MGWGLQVRFLREKMNEHENSIVTGLRDDQKQRNQTGKGVIDIAMGGFVSHHAL